MTVAKRFYVETLGCPKNQVDSDKLIGTLLAEGTPEVIAACAASHTGRFLRPLLDER